jgi:hypothetical protein
VRAIANPIHKFKGVKVERAFGEMVLDKKKAATDASGFGENFTDLVGVVEYVDEHTDVEGRIRKQNVRAVENPAGNAASRALSYFNALNLGGR